MDNLIEIIKGIHPGKFIERELKKKLEFEEGFFAILQTHYDIKFCKKKVHASLYTEAVVK